MKILIISDSDITGGASIAAYRFHRSLIKGGVDSYMLVRFKKSNDHKVISPHSFLNKAISKSIIYLNRIFSKLFVKQKNILFTFNFITLKFVKNAIDKINPDVINVHWVSENLIDYKYLASLKKIVIITLHDMNHFTGGCHYNSECFKYLSSCSGCHLLRYDTLFNLARKFQLEKYRYLNQIDKLLIFGTSNWICDEARGSYILNNKTIINLPTPIDTNTFTPSTIKKK